MIEEQKQLNLKNVNLTEEEKADLMEFLKALECPCPLEAPELPQGTQQQAQ